MRGIRDGAPPVAAPGHTQRRRATGRSLLADLATPDRVFLALGLVLVAGAVSWWSWRGVGGPSHHSAPSALPDGSSSMQDRISAAAQKHLSGGQPPASTSSVAMTGEVVPSGDGRGAAGEDVCQARVERARAAEREQCSTSSIPAWQRLLPPPVSIPGHMSGLQAQQAAQLASAEERMKRVEIYGEEGDPEDVMPEAPNSQPSGLDYPGLIKLGGKASDYSIGGMGLLRAEPYLREGSSFFIKNEKQPVHTMDSFYVRLVGPSIVMAGCRLTANHERTSTHGTSEYICSYKLREAGVYTLQVWAEYRGLPVSILGDANPKGNDPDPVVANSCTFERAELLLYTGLVDGRYAEGSAASMGSFARGIGGEARDMDASVAIGGPRECAQGLRQGRWVARQVTGCVRGQYQLLREAWEWRPIGCRLREFCGTEGMQCLSQFKTIAVAGDSIARELFDEVGSAMLQRDVSWREIFPHKHASGSRQVGDTMIKMMWIPDPLTTITRHLQGPIQLREQYTTSDLLVVSAGYWYIYRTSLETYLEGVRNLTQAVSEVLGSRTRVVWVTTPAGWMNFGYRIRPRIEHWNKAASQIAEEAGWTVLDTFHLSDARPEKTDGTHIGNDTDRVNMQGPPTMSKAMGNMLLGALCGAQGMPQPDPSTDRHAIPTLPIEWPNWPSSRRYASREALMRAKNPMPVPQAKKTGAEDRINRGKKQPVQHIITLGSQMLSGGLGRGSSGGDGHGAARGHSSHSQRSGGGGKKKPPH